MIKAGQRPGPFGLRVVLPLLVSGVLAVPAGLSAGTAPGFAAQPPVSAAAPPPSASASASARGQDCPATVAALPEGLAGWDRRRPLEAARAPEGLAAAGLTVGRAVEARLHPVALEGRDKPEAASEKGGRPSSGFGGLFAFSVSGAGVYRIALGAAAWVDVAGEDGPLASVGHAHGPACSGIRKMVDFALAPGRYRLMLSKADRANLPVMIVRLR